MNLIANLKIQIFLSFDCFRSCSNLDKDGSRRQSVQSFGIAVEGRRIGET